jgi:pyridoxamine 5'-phosphate oxidase
MTIDLYHEALARFAAVRERAAQLNLAEPDAMALATADANARPSVRIVLLRGLDERGLVFFTNSHSEKGLQLAENPQASLCFYWDQLAEQVRIAGRVEVVSEAESDAYWSRRRRLSQVAAVASDQSAVLADYAGYERRVRQLEQQYAGQPVPRPPHWLGYRVVPQRIEFWEGRDGRMHVRTVYEECGNVWVKFLLYP